MQKIRVPITRAENASDSTPSPKRLQFVGILLLAAISGFVIGKSPNLPLATPGANSRILLGAVGSDIASIATLQQTDDLNVTVSAFTPPTEGLAAEDTSSKEIMLIPIVSPQPTPARSREELETLIKESQDAISREGGEIARIRDASITLVGEFETNCGDWEDDCARYYVIALEQHNNAYNDLVRKIEYEERALEDLQTELSLTE